MTQDIRKYNIIEDVYGEGLIGHRDDLINIYREHLKQMLDDLTVDGIIEIVDLLKELDMQGNNYLMHVCYPYNKYEAKVISKEV